MEGADMEKRPWSGAIQDGLPTRRPAKMRLLSVLFTFFRSFAEVRDCGGEEGTGNERSLAATTVPPDTLRQHLASAKFKPATASGGEEGIRTLETRLAPTPLAGERLRPLGHLSGNDGYTARARISSVVAIPDRQITA